MKVLLICAGGMSTSILMKKLEKYASAHDIDLEILARGMNDYDDVYQRYDVILLGPQVSYQKSSVESNTKKPVAVIAPYDYAIGNAENIFKQIKKLCQVQ